MAFPVKSMVCWKLNQGKFCGFSTACYRNLWYSSLSYVFAHRFERFYQSLYPANVNAMRPVFLQKAVGTQRILGIKKDGFKINLLILVNIDMLNNKKITNVGG